MNSEILKNLIDLLSKYEEDRAIEEQTIDDFLDWASNKPTAPTFELPHEYKFSSNQLQTFIADYLSRAYKYMYLYSKKAFEEIPNLSFQDYLYLVKLTQKEVMTKTELIDSRLNEKTSGMLVIKRLLDQGLIKQFDNKKDKRSQFVELTDEGSKILQAVQPRMSQVTEILTKALSPEERKQLASLLLKFNSYHEPLRFNHRDDSLDELIAATS